MTTINSIMLFKEIISFYSKDLMKLKNTISVQNGELQNVKVGGTYSYHSVSVSSPPGPLLRACSNPERVAAACKQQVLLCQMQFF
jgi:hypothetical protein